MHKLAQMIEDIGSAQLGAVLHLGAGVCREADEYLRLKAKKVMLVEANPEVVGRLRSKVRGMARVEVVSAAVAAKEGEAILHVLNNPRETSLHRPAALLKHCPNLSESREVTVPALTLSQLVGRLSPDASLDNLLVLELQGAELSVLSSASTGALQKFRWIAVRGSMAALYEDGARLEQVDALLQRSGFRPASRRHDEAAWPFRNVLYGRDTQLVRLAALDNQVHEHELTMQSQRKALEERSRRMSALEGEKASLEQRTALLEGESAKLRRAHEEQTRLAGIEAQKLRQAHEEQVRLARIEAEKLRQAHEEQVRLARIEAEKLRQAHEEQVRLARIESEKLRRAHEGQARLEKNEVASRQELVEARQAAALSTKLQTLREADLRDLQERYRQSLSIQERQRNLLVTLAERLGAASVYFRQLAGSEAVLLPADAEKPLQTGAAGGKRIRPRAGRRRRRVRGTKS